MPQYITPRELHSIRLDHVACAQEYHEMAHDPHDFRVAESYESFINSTMRQWDALVDPRRHGVTVEFFQGEPRYSCSADMLADIRAGHLWTFVTGDESGLPEDHPMSQTVAVAGWEYQGERPRIVNDLFRAVHDYFGHGPSQGSFGVVGEMNAWLAHSVQYPYPARMALFCETRGQSAWTNAYGSNGALPLAERPFAEQKAGVIEEVFWS